MTTSTLTAVTDPGPGIDSVTVEETTSVAAKQSTAVVEDSTVLEEPVVLDVPEAKAEYLDPAELVIAENVRKSFDLTKCGSSLELRRFHAEPKYIPGSSWGMDAWVRGDHKGAA
ncbi:hypothetical protein ACIHAX_36480 [Nocardia sp. NPDC051929]|uniref:hypothetical protein n=1 Tax=Nocardia sp. NPDC051929 TaxID=3364327 RepID=UPI0037CCA948